MRTFVLAAALAVLAAPRASADLVFLNGGEELSGSVVSVSSADVVLQADGKETSTPLSKVLKVKLVRVYGLPGETDAGRVADPDLKALLAAPPKPSDFPDDGYVTLRDEKDCAVGEDRRAVCTRRVVRAVLRERAKEKAANVRTYYLDGVEKAGIDWARAFNGNKVSDLDDTSVEQGSEYSRYPDYDRLKSVKFAMPDVATGTVIDYRTRLESPVDVATEPFMASMSFRSFEPVVLARFTLTTPKDVPFAVFAHGLPKGAEVKVEDLGASVRRTWEVRDVPSFKEEDQMPPLSRIAPYVEVAPASTWPEAARAASDAIAPLLAPDAAVAAQAAAVVKGKKTPAAKAEALYDWVAAKVKYESVTMGSYSFVPKAPGTILAAKAGDALDKPFLLFALLRAAGLKPQLAYLKDKGDYPFEQTLPSLGQFSAAAVLLDVGGKRRVLVPLEDNHRWLDVPEWLQGVGGLVVTGPEAGKTFVQPLTAAAREGESDRLSLSLSADGSLTGSATLLPQGADQASWRALKDWKRQDVDHEFEQLVHEIHPQARLVKYSVDGLEDPTRDLRVHVSFAIKDYALTASGGYMAFRLPWVEASAEGVGAPSREQPLFWWKRAREDKDMTVRLPRGWRLYYAPPPAVLSGPGSTYHASYEPRAGTLRYSSRSRREDDTVLPGDYARYKEFREAVARYAQRWIVVKKG
ncbi:MAG: DUF3857 and transglutaminase domain-containing protein [Elusimicrobia bacterium]|nr:DUF3857 and transglutaminase domain-containing protein [Elusimicrobiota bacterium]